MKKHMLEFILMSILLTLGLFTFSQGTQAVGNDDSVAEIELLPDPNPPTHIPSGEVVPPTHPKFPDTSGGNKQTSNPTGRFPQTGSLMERFSFYGLLVEIAVLILFLILLKRRRSDDDEDKTKFDA